MPARFGYPKDRRIRRPRLFRATYDQGRRVTTPWFSAFLLAVPDLAGPKFGFTCPRALGRAHVRNRIRRRMKEAVRLRQAEFGPGWMIVFNPRRSVLQTSFQDLLRSLDKVVAACR